MYKTKRTLEHFPFHDISPYMLSLQDVLKKFLHILDDHLSDRKYFT